MDKTQEPEKDSRSVPTIRSISSQITEKGITECSFSYNSFVKLHGKKISESQHDPVISKSML